MGAKKQESIRLHYLTVYLNYLTAQAAKYTEIEAQAPPCLLKAMTSQKQLWQN